MKKKFDLRSSLSSLASSWPKPGGELVYYIEDDHVWLHKIRLPRECRGRGTEMLASFLALTDKAGLPVCLTADPVEEDSDPLHTNPNTFDLVKWYARFGFDLLGPSEDGFLMQRDAKSCSPAEIIKEYQSNKKNKDLIQEDFDKWYVGVHSSARRTLGS